MIGSKNQTVALRAAEAVLDRGYGRPLQAMQLPEEPQEKPRRVDLSKLTDEEFEAVLRGKEIMRRLIAETDALSPSPGTFNAPG
ncbi:MAG TPA: hypothetical protein VK901_20760 [Nitrospiraceae bacterium]|nr:hypothetical protein [Nitrospiraceae bacterium]